MAIEFIQFPFKWGFGSIDKIVFIIKLPTSPSFVLRVIIDLKLYSCKIVFTNHIHCNHS